MSGRVAVRVTPDALRQIRSGHPWVFEGSIRSTGEGRVGDLAVVFDERRRFAAIGLWDPTSPIRVRVLHQGNPRPIDADFWQERLTAAVARRAPLAGSDVTTAYRVVHGENDGLPGLVVDRYAGVAVLKAYSAAWIPHLDAIGSALTQAVGPLRLVRRFARSIGPTAHLDPDPVAFTENGLAFVADVARGQKTGHFLDQRENRARVRELAGGRSVLDVFCCTGGFAVHAAAGGAKDLTLVDQSRQAMTAAGEHLALNGFANLPTRQHVGDAFAELARLRDAGRSFDLVIVDPPSFANRQSQVPRALDAYTRLRHLALSVLAPGGIVVQASCSARVTEHAFLASLARAAGDRDLVQLELTGHALDHPVGFAQGRYLKADFSVAT